MTTAWQCSGAWHTEDMPLPKRLAAFNRSVSNRILGPLARSAPGFLLITHRGRNSGRTYTTPVNAFRQGASGDAAGDGDRLMIALTYGADTDWVRNVRAAGGCEGVRRRRRIVLDDPRTVATADGMAVMPAPVRVALGVLDVTEFMSLRVRPTDDPPPSA